MAGGFTVCFSIQVHFYGIGSVFGLIVMLLIISWFHMELHCGSKCDGLTP